MREFPSPNPLPQGARANGWMRRLPSSLPSRESARQGRERVSATLIQAPRFVWQNPSPGASRHPLPPTSPHPSPFVPSPQGGRAKNGCAAHAFPLSFLSPIYGRECPEGAREGEHNAAPSAALFLRWESPSPQPSPKGARAMDGCAACLSLSSRERVPPGLSPSLPLCSLFPTLPLKGEGAICPPLHLWRGAREGWQKQHMPAKLFHTFRVFFASAPLCLLQNAEMLLAWHACLGPAPIRRSCSPCVAARHPAQRMGCMKKRQGKGKGREAHPPPIPFQPASGARHAK
jgi:hypothetical protein